MIHTKERDFFFTAQDKFEEHNVTKNIIIIIKLPMADSKKEENCLYSLPVVGKPLTCIYN